MQQIYKEKINISLRDHQKQADWFFNSLAKSLHTWAERMTVQFKLEVGTPAIMIDHLRRGRLGHYRKGRNSFGLMDEIAIDVSHVKNNPYWQVLGTLLHELLHAFQEHHGTPPSHNCFNYHNTELRKKAEELGLIVDRYGHTKYKTDDKPFQILLMKYGVEVPQLPNPNPELAVATKRGSKLILYECPCGVKARIGRSRFNAKCLDCGGVFHRKV